MNAIAHANAACKCFTGRMLMQDGGLFHHDFREATAEIATHVCHF